MADRPILFSAPMIRALLAGTKTQTRRVVKPQPDVFGLAPLGDKMISAAEWQIRQSGRIKINVGDRLWVKEAHYITDDGHEHYAVYSEDQQSVYEHLAAIDSMQADLKLSDSWAKPHRKQRPSIFMPRWASRLTLNVTDVRVERLNDISREDAISEGLIQVDHAPPLAVEMDCNWGFEGDDRYGSPISAYAALWDHINGAGAWESNPWIVAYSFIVHHGNIDQIAQVAA